MKTPIKVQLRLESEVNQFWNVTFDDGSISKYYAFEESPRCEETDETLWDTNQSKLSDWLEELCQLSTLINLFDPSTDAITMDIDVLTRTISNVIVQKQDDRPGNKDGYRYINIKKTYQY